MTTPRPDVLVIGAGQAGLATAYYLRRAGLVAGEGFSVIDANSAPGGAWQHTWPSLRLFSPAAFSSLPGRPMPRSDEDYPPASHVVDYLTEYEARYDLPVQHGVRALDVHRGDDDPQGRLVVETPHCVWSPRVVVSATGTWGRPFVPTVPGAGDFGGRQVHSASYDGPLPFAGSRVLVVGGGNSGAQLVAELSAVADTTWFTVTRPRFLPDDVDGRVLFDVATARRRALDAGRDDPGGVSGLGDVVAVASVRAARDRGAMVPHPMFARFTPTGVVDSGGHEVPADAVIWCTGFRPDLPHLAGLRLPRHGGHPLTVGTRARDEPRLHLVGYGDWTGPASATLIGVGRTAREAVSDIVTFGEREVGAAGE